LVALPLVKVSFPISAAVVFAAADVVASTCTSINGALDKFWQITTYAGDFGVSFLFVFIHVDKCKQLTSLKRGVYKRYDKLRQLK